MSKFWNLLTIIRPTNVLMIGLSQCFYYIFLIRVFYSYAALSPELSPLMFTLVCLATMLIAAAGNVWNDINDTEIDSVNHKNRALVNGVISSDQAFNLYIVLNVIAVGLLVIVNFTTRSMSPNYVFLLAISILWIYSSQWKLKGLVGNLAISVLAALPLWAVFLYHKKILYSGSPIQIGLVKLLLIQTLAYSAFAFLITLCREIVKDIEDIEGDKQSGSKSLPILIGVQRTKFILLLLIVIVSALAAWMVYLFFDAKEAYHATYILLSIMLPLLATIYLLFVSKFHWISLVFKWILLFGIFSLPVFYYINLWS